MASVYARGKILWISAYDQIKGKTIARSTRLEDTKSNRILVEQKAQELQKQLDENAKLIKEGDIQNDSIKKAFKHHLKINRNKHPKTIKDYHRFYKKFIETFDESEECSVITKKSIEKWLIDMKDDGINILSYYRQLSNFLSTLFEYDYIPQFIINRSIRPKPPKKEKIVFTPADLETVFQNLSKKPEHFRVMIFTAFYTGIRPTELMQIYEIDLQNRTMRYRAKGGLDRRIAFHKELVPIFQERLDNVASKQLLPYTDPDNMSQAFRRYLQQIGLDGKGYSLRTFRKTFMTLASYYRMNQAIVDELVSHSPGKTSFRYYVNISIAEQQKELEKYRIPTTTDRY